MSFLKLLTDDGNVQGMSAEVLRQSVEGGQFAKIGHYLDELVRLAK